MCPRRKVPIIYFPKPLCVGTINVDKSSLTYRRNVGQRLDVPILIWVLRSNVGGVTIVDTGAHATAFTPGAARSQRETEKVIVALSAAGVDPNAVRTVILTHLHYDHAGNCELFPNARLFVQRRELEYARRPLPVHRLVYQSPALALPSERWTVVEGDTEISPGLSVLLTPGHTPGLQAVLLETAKGHVVLASDTVPLGENWRGEPPDMPYVPTGAFIDLCAYDRTMRRLASTGARVVPGHDPAVLSEAWPQ